jgi:hypothetical protein
LLGKSSQADYTIYVFNIIAVTTVLIKLQDKFKKSNHFEINERFKSTIIKINLLINLKDMRYGASSQKEVQRYTYLVNYLIMIKYIGRYQYSQ